MTLTSTAHDTYSGSTEGMQVAPEALSLVESASAAFLELPVLPAAACVDQAGVEWVPDVEREQVPEQLRQLCLSCAGRPSCLQWAVTSDSVGYWAGSTALDREQMVSANRVGLPAADELQAAARLRAAELEAADRELARHPAGQDSLRSYRRGGCRCSRCRAHNAAQRGLERARARRAEVPAAAASARLTA